MSPVPGPLSAAERVHLVAAIHDTPTMLVLVVAGGGNAAITDLLTVGGASRTVLEVQVPYAASAMAGLVDADVLAAGAVTAGTVAALAAAARSRARQLAPDGVPVVGVACTAALVSDRPKRGDHRAHIATAGFDRTSHRYLELDKGRLDRLGEDRVVADEILRLTAVACGVPD